VCSTDSHGLARLASFCAKSGSLGSVGGVRASPKSKASGVSKPSSLGTSEFRK
jgi:hypothetical protein